MRISTTPSPSFLRRGALMIISRGALMFIRRGAQMIIRRGVQMIITLLLCFVSTSMKADTIRPWTFWYWMYGAVSKEGIKADLQAMKDVGLGGCYLMPIRGVTEKPTYQGEVQQLTPKFWEMVDYAMQQSDSLGLEMGIHICDGFALAGGPWISPEESMQKVVWSDTIITVTSKNQNIPISQPAKGNQDYYEDIATYAIRAYNPLPKPHESGTIVRNENGDFRSKEAGYIQYDFDEPQTVRSIKIIPSGNNVQAQRLLVQASDDGETFHDVRQLTPPRQGWQNTDENYTYSIPETTAKHFRFYWTPEGTEPGSEDLDAAKWSPVLKVKDIKLSADASIDQYEAKNGSVWRIANEECRMKNEELKDSGISEIRYPSIINLQTIASDSSFFILHSSLRTLPLGTWRIIRFGHTSTEHTNATGGGGKGLECDKFSVAAINIGSCRGVVGVALYHGILVVGVAEFCRDVLLQGLLEFSNSKRDVIVGTVFEIGITHSYCQRVTVVVVGNHGEGVGGNHETSEVYMHVAAFHVAFRPTKIWIDNPVVAFVVGYEVATIVIEALTDIAESDVEVDEIISFLVFLHVLKSRCKRVITRQNPCEDTIVPVDGCGEKVVVGQRA